MFWSKFLLKNAILNSLIKCFDAASRLAPRIVCPHLLPYYVTVCLSQIIFGLLSFSYMVYDSTCIFALLQE